MKLFLFDFDGTISRSDSMVEFLKFLYKGRSFYLTLFLNSWKLLPAILCRDNNKTLKERLLKIFLLEFEIYALRNQANHFSVFYQKELKDSALKYIANIKKDEANRIIVITASLDIWIKPIIENLGVELICTESRIVDNRFDGIKGNNCKGKEKVRKIREKLNLQEFDEIHCFGNSLGDKEMLEISTNPNMNYFS